MLLVVKLSRLSLVFMIVDIVLFLNLRQFLWLLRLESLSVLFPSLSNQIHFISSSLILVDLLSLLSSQFYKALVWSCWGSRFWLWLFFFRLSKENSINFLDLSVYYVDSIRIHPERALIQTKFSFVLILCDYTDISFLNLFQLGISFLARFSWVAILPCIFGGSNPSRINTLLFLL
jgi:hypothetical protein